MNFSMAPGSHLKHSKMAESAVFHFLYTNIFGGVGDVVGWQITTGLMGILYYACSILINTLQWLWPLTSKMS